MSDNGTTVDASTEKPLFTEKEHKILIAAMISLKSGPPEIDMAKFTVNGGFNTTKTASNTWGKIKAKLVQLSAKEGTPVANSAVAEPKTPKKRAKAPSDDDEGGDNVPSTKKVRKSPVKKNKVKAEAEAEAEDGDDTVE